MCFVLLCVFTPNKPTCKLEREKDVYNLCSKVIVDCLLPGPRDIATLGEFWINNCLYLYLHLSFRVLLLLFSILKLIFSNLRRQVRQRVCREFVRSILVLGQTISAIESQQSGIRSLGCVNFYGECKN